jgi:hypothetical protein
MNDHIVAVGALGGSGTRVCAQILIESGIYMGDELNNANDNLLFTRLFKNPQWFDESSLDEKKKRFEIFAKCMRGQKLSVSERSEIIHSICTNPTVKINLNYLIKMGFEKPHTVPQHNIWGWKEPNTQIYIKELLDFFPKLKYIHVIRHGLDMAFSTNKQQLRNWGYKFGIHVHESDTEIELARKQLDYWIASNSYVINAGEKSPENFYLLNYETLCKKPAKEIKNIAEFLNIEIPDHLMEKLTSIPAENFKKQRYLHEDITIFTPKQLDAVRKFEFDTDLS